MSETQVRRRSRPSRPESEQPPAENRQGSQTVPPAIEGTSVFRKVPEDVRQKLDDMLATGHGSKKAIEESANVLSLEKRYGISMEALREYAERVDALVRPVIAHQLVMALLDRLPPETRKEMTCGGQILLLSRVIQVLTTRIDGGVTTADLADLTDILFSIPAWSGKTVAGSRKHEVKDEAAKTPAAPARLAEAVRQIYGLSWPPAAASNTQSGNPLPSPPEMANPPVGA